MQTNNCKRCRQEFLGNPLTKICQECRIHSKTFIQQTTLVKITKHIECVVFRKDKKTERYELIGEFCSAKAASERINCSPACAWHNLNDIRNGKIRFTIFGYLVIPKDMMKHSNFNFLRSV